MNLVDSCGWLEYFGNGSNADFFAPVIENVGALLVPSLVVFEVSKRLQKLYGAEGEARGMVFLEKGFYTNGGDSAFMRQAAAASALYKLAMADAIIWQTAESHQAQFYTQDADLKGLPGVVYQEKRKPL